MLADSSVILNYQEYRAKDEQFLQYQQLTSIIRSKINIIINLLPHSRLAEEIMKIMHPREISSKPNKLISNTDGTKVPNDLDYSPIPDFWTENCFLHD